MEGIFIFLGIVAAIIYVIIFVVLLDIQKSLKQLVRWEEERDIKARRDHISAKDTIDNNDDFSQLTKTINKTKNNSWKKL